ncbi:MAG TPA: phasin family protein [Allosphingosinicella sp.]|jgi:phasin family protein
MADTNTTSTAPKADTPAAAPRAVENAADAAPKAAAQASPASAPAAAKPAAAATAKAAVAPAKAAARAAKRSAKAPAKSSATKRAAKAAPAKRAPARRTAAQKAAVQKAAVTRSLNSAKTTTTNAINQGTQTMKKEANQAADRIQAVFGDVNERARTAVERNSRLAEEMTELAKGNVEALVASTKVAAKGVETIGQEVAEMSRKSFEDASAALKGFADVKSPTDLFRLQSDFARSQFDMIVAESSKLSETMLKLAGQVAEPITGRYSVAAERVRSAVAF